MLGLIEVEIMSRMRHEFELRDVLWEAEALLSEWEQWMKTDECRHDRKAFIEAVRNYNALRGAIKTMRWVLRFPGIDDPLF